MDAALREITTLSRRLVHINTTRNEGLARIETHLENQLAQTRQHNVDMNTLMIHLKDVAGKSGERVRLLAEGNQIHAQLLTLQTSATEGWKVTNDLLRQILSDSRLYYFNARGNAAYIKDENDPVEN